MFWGLNLKANRKYSQTATRSFHISQAALDPESAQDDTPNQLIVSSDNQKFLVCTLRKNTCEQALLDLNFSKGDTLSFQSSGSGNITLSGYMIQEDMLSDLEDDEDSEVDEVTDLRETLNKKTKGKTVTNEIAAKSNKKATKAAIDEEDDDDDDEDDSDFNADATLDDDDENEEDDDEDEDDDDEDVDEDDDEDEEEDESEDEEVQQPKAKQPKLDKQQKLPNGVAKDNKAAGPESVGEKKGKKDKKEKNKNQQQQNQQQQQQQNKGERTLSGGVKVEDIKVGNGPEAKNGKRAVVYYEGRLKSNNKVFDSLKQGNGFKFMIGRGEVIKGWEVGVAGMKVGGKRRVTCPPHMAYGARGSPPQIPPNSTLVFDIELKGVN